MADNPLGIGGRGTGGVDILKDALGLGAPWRAEASAGASASAASARGDAFGARGKRMLPADYPMDQLDHGARRGTYLDILV